MKSIKEKYLLLKFHNVLFNDRLPDNLSFTIYSPSVYLVVFNIIHNNGEVNLIYHYMPYYKLFADTLLLHLIIREDFTDSALRKYWGDFYTFIDYSFEYE